MLEISENRFLWSTLHEKQIVTNSIGVKKLISMCLSFRMRDKNNEYAQLVCKLGTKMWYGCKMLTFRQTGVEPTLFLKPACLFTSFLHLFNVCIADCLFLGKKS